MFHPDGKDRTRSVSSFAAWFIIVERSQCKEGTVRAMDERHTKNARSSVNCFPMKMLMEIAMGRQFSRYSNVLSSKRLAFVRCYLD